SPLHLGHGSVITSPVPWHVGQARCVCVRPKKLSTTSVTTPVPLQVLHLPTPEGVRAPLPPHWSQATNLLILSFLVVPFTISFRVSRTFTRRSEPRFTRRAPPAEPPKPPNPPKPLKPPPKWPPKMSPNWLNISS